MRRIKLVLSLFTFMNLLIAQPETTTNPGPPNPLLCTTGELKINEFSGRKAFKVVVGIPFKFRGTHVPLDEPYSWELGHGDLTNFVSYWPLSPTPAVLTGQTTIPTLALPENNAEFGETNGVVRLKSNSNAITLSTDPDLSKKVQIFFMKYDNNPNTFAPLLEPNWFYYWKQFVDFKDIDIFSYKENIKSVCPGSDRACTKIPLTYPNDANFSYFGPLCSTSGTWVPNNKGIHHFIEIISHEDMHIQIFKKLWKDGYDPNLDKDYDFYPDAFEIEEAAKGKYKFTISLPKIGSDPSIDAFGYVFAYPKGKWSVGKQYEEDLCNEAQRNANVILKDSFDWSYDPQNLYQGKNWK